jgi:hypothetical protein
MFLTYSELLNSLDSGATTKITINNHRMNKADFETSILMPMRGMNWTNTAGSTTRCAGQGHRSQGITQEKYLTISVLKKDIEEARTYFSRIGADLVSHFAALVPSAWS